VGTLSGILKYPYGRGEWVDTNEENSWQDDLVSLSGRSSGKFGYYKTETEAFDTIRENIEGQRRTIVAEIMDYADDLTYAIHDLTDFYMDGRLPLDRLLREASEDEFKHTDRRELNNLESDLGYDDTETTPTEVIEFLASNAYTVAPDVFRPYDATADQEDDLEEFTSHLVEIYLNRVYYPDETKAELESKRDTDLFITLEESGNEQYHLMVSEKLQDHIDILQDLTRHYVIRNSTLMGQQRGERQVIRELFEALYDEASVSDLRESAVPKPYSELLDEDPEVGGSTVNKNNVQEL